MLARMVFLTVMVAAISVYAQTTTAPSGGDEHLTTLPASEPAAAATTDNEVSGTVKGTDVYVRCGPSTNSYPCPRSTSPPR